MMYDEMVRFLYEIEKMKQNINIIVHPSMQERVQQEVDAHPEWQTFDRLITVFGSDVIEDPAQMYVMREAPPYDMTKPLYSPSSPYDRLALPPSV